MSKTTSVEETSPEMCVRGQAGPNRVWEDFSIRPAMKVQVLIQDQDSLLFHRSPNEWTADVGSAEDFKTVIKAIDFAVRNRLHGVHVVMRFANPEYDLQMPLNF